MPGAIAFTPLVFGTAVARTVAHDLVPSGGDPAVDRVDSIWSQACGLVLVTARRFALYPPSGAP